MSAVANNEAIYNAAVTPQPDGVVGERRVHPRAGGLPVAYSWQEFLEYAAGRNMPIHIIITTDA